MAETPLAVRPDEHGEQTAAVLCRCLVQAAQMRDADHGGVLHVDVYAEIGGG